MIEDKKSTRLEIVVFKTSHEPRKQSYAGKFGCDAGVELHCRVCRRGSCCGCEAWDVPVEVPVILDQDVISGEVVLSPPKGGLTCRCIKVSFIGELWTYKRKDANIVFKRESRDLQGRDHITSSSRYKFSFSGESMTPYETYSGTHLQVRYYIQASVLRRFGTKITTIQEVIVERPSYLPEVTRAFKMEAGNERSLQVEMECNKWRYHQDDVIKGFLKFLRLDIEIKRVELQIILKEKEINQGKERTLSELTVLKQEVMDGSPLDNGAIPIRVHLAPLSICPTVKNVEDKFCVRYYLKLIITDTLENVFYKSQELIVYRKNRLPKNISKPRAASMVVKATSQ